MFAVVREIRCPCIGPARGLHSLLSISRFFALQLPVVTMLVETTIENAKFGWYQIYTLLVVWGSLFADGGEMLCISLISKEMGTSFKWKNQSEVSHYVGILGSLTFFGFLLGSLYGGKLIDIFGRRNPFILFNLTTFVFGMASSFSPTVWYLALCRFFTGMGVGGSIPCATAVLAEICPNKERRVVILTKTIGFVLGEILLGFEAQYILPTFKDPDRAWRTLLIVASLPAFVALLLSIFFLDESPRFLEINIARGEEELVRMEKKHDPTSDSELTLQRKRIASQRHHLVDVLSRMWNQNKNAHKACCCPCCMCTEPTVPIKTKEFLDTGKHFKRNGKQGEMLELCKSPVEQPDRGRVTIVLFLVWFLQSYMYYGVIFTFPITLTHAGESTKNMTTQVVYAAMGELLGALSAIFLVDLPFFGTRRLLLFEEFLAAATFVLCAVIAAMPKNVANRSIMFFWLVFTTKVWTNGTFDLVYPYTAEYFPTRLRGTSVGFMSAGARVGGMVVPYVALQLHDKLGRGAPYWNFAVAGVLGTVLIFILPEVKGMTVEGAEESPDDTEPLLRGVELEADDESA